MAMLRMFGQWNSAAADTEVRDPTRISWARWREGVWALAELSGKACVELALCEVDHLVGQPAVSGGLFPVLGHQEGAA